VVRCKKLSGLSKRMSEVAIQMKIYEMRPDIPAILRAHPPWPRASRRLAAPGTARLDDAKPPPVKRPTGVPNERWCGQRWTEAATAPPAF